MVITVDVLSPVLPVFYGFMRLEIRGIRLSGADIPTVPFVLDHPIDGGRIPYFVTKLGSPSIAGKQVGDLRRGPAVEIQIVNHLYSFRLIGIDHKFSILVQIVAQQLWGQENALAEAAFDRPVHNKGFRSRLLFRNRSKDGKHQRACCIQRIEIVLVKMDAHAQLLQLVNNGKTVHNITGKTGDRLCQDVLDLSRLGILNHLEHPFPMRQICT